MFGQMIKADVQIVRAVRLDGKPAPTTVVRPWLFQPKRGQRPPAPKQIDRSDLKSVRARACRSAVLFLRKRMDTPFDQAQDERGCGWGV